MVSFFKGKLFSDIKILNSGTNPRCGRGYTFNNGVIFQIEKIILLFPLTKTCAFFKFIKQREGGREN